jgi:hypothetical protein
MKCGRNDLIAKLRTVEPGRAIKNRRVPLLSHYWFTGEYLMTYNEQIALAVPFATDFKGAFPGTLLKLLQFGGKVDDEIELTTDGRELLIKYGAQTNRSTRLLVLAPKFPFTMPQPGANQSYPVSPALLKAVESCMFSVGINPSTGDQPHITLDLDQGGISVYATDGRTFSRASVRFDDAKILMHRVKLPAEFFKQMLRQARTSVINGTLEIGGGKDGYALFQVGTTCLYGRSLRCSPFKFARALDSVLPHNMSGFVEIPERFDAAVERAAIICAERRLQVKLTVRSGELRFFSQSNGVGVTDHMPIGKAHPDVSIRVEPKPLTRARQFKEILITKNCIVMTRGLSRNQLFVIPCTPPRPDDVD